MIFGMQKDHKITFSWMCFRTRLYAKRQFPKGGVRKVGKQCELRLDSWCSKVYQSLDTLHIIYDVKIVHILNYSDCDCAQKSP